MCEATVYLEWDGRREKVMQDVAQIEVTKAGIALSKLFGPPEIIQGVIRKVDFLEHTVTLAAAGGDT